MKLKKEKQNRLGRIVLIDLCVFFDFQLKNSKFVFFIFIFIYLFIFIFLSLSLFFLPEAPVHSCVS